MISCWGVTRDTRSDSLISTSAYKRVSFFNSLFPAGIIVIVVLKSKLTYFLLWPLLLRHIRDSTMQKGWRKREKVKGAEREWLSGCGNGVCGVTEQIRQSDGRGGAEEHTLPWWKAHVWRRNNQFGSFVSLLWLLQHLANIWLLFLTLGLFSFSDCVML